MAQNLSMGISPSHTITVSNFIKLKNKDEQIQKLIEISKVNLENTLKILKWNIDHEIFMYRLSSKLIPLATWQGISFDFKKVLKKELKQVGNYIKKNNIRVSAHPDHFSVINTPKEEVFQATIKELKYHDDFMTAMGLDNSYKLVVHVGGKYGDKISGKQRFIHRYCELPKKIQKRIIIENDDKTYNATDVLEICNTLKVPMVLDVHHFNVNNEGEELKKILPKAFDTWTSESFPPKIHFSTPRNEKEMRAHAEYINQKDFLTFLLLAKKVGRDFDIMLEAKAKDLSVLTLKKLLPEKFW